MIKTHRQLGVVMLAGLVANTLYVSAVSLLPDYQNICNPTSTVIVTSSTGLDSLIPLAANTLYVLESPVNIITQTITTAGPCVGLVGSGMQAEILSPIKLSTMYQNLYDNGLIANIIIDGGKNADTTIRPMGGRTDQGIRISGNGLWIQDINIRNISSRPSTKGYGLNAIGINNSRIENVSVLGGTYGINIDNSSYNTMRQLSVNGTYNGSNPEVGIMIQNSDPSKSTQYNTIDTVSISNTVWQGLQTDGLSVNNNTISNLSVSGVIVYGALSLCDGSNNTFSGLNLSNNKIGIALGGPMQGGSPYGVPNGPSLCNNAGIIENNTFSQLAVTNNTIGVRILNGNGPNSITNNIFNNGTIAQNTQVQIINNSDSTTYLGEMTITSPTFPDVSDITGKCLIPGNSTAIFNQTRVVSYPTPQPRNAIAHTGMTTLYGMNFIATGTYATGFYTIPVPVGTIFSGYNGNIAPFVPSAPGSLRCSTKIESAGGLQYSLDNGMTRRTSASELRSGNIVAIQFTSSIPGLQTGVIRTANNTGLVGAIFFALPPIVFNPVNNVELITPTDSNTVLYTGMMPLTITGITNGSYAITGCTNPSYNTSGFVTTTGVLGPNCQIIIRTTSSSTNSTPTSAILHLSLGSLSAQSPFVVTTKAATAGGGSSTTTVGAGGGGGGGGGSALNKDNCPGGDFSPSYYDNSCGVSNMPQETGPLANRLQAIIDGFGSIRALCIEDNPEFVGLTQFIDTIGHRYEPAINTLVSYCAVVGRPGGRFEPDSPPARGVTYAEAIKITTNVMRIMNNTRVVRVSDATNNAASRYPGLDTNQRYAAYINAGIEYGVMKDIEQPIRGNNNQFSLPDMNAEIPRSDLIQMVTNAAVTRGMRNFTVSFAQSSIVSRGDMANVVTRIFNIIGDDAFINANSKNLQLLGLIQKRLSTMTPDQQVAYLTMVRNVFARASNRVFIVNNLNKQALLKIINQLLSNNSAAIQRTVL